MEKETLNKLNWRYATKAFDPEKKLSEEQVHLLKEAMRLAPSSIGFQPWKFIEVKNPELRAKIRERSWGQAQVTDASHLFILCARTNLNEEHVDAHIHKTAKTHGAPVEAFDAYKAMMMGNIEHKSTEEKITWAERQVYIALGMALTVAAMNEIDTCPMEGFDRNAVNELLGLDGENLTAVVFLTAGFRKQDDPAASRPKVRFDEEEVFIQM